MLEDLKWVQVGTFIADETGRGSKDEIDAAIVGLPNHPSLEGAMVRKTPARFSALSFPLPLYRFRPIQSHNSVKHEHPRVQQ